MTVTRFAPSPTGPLHLGHAFAALTAEALARGGSFLLRIEDIDRSRARPEWEARIGDDLRWLGLAWPEPVLRQSERLGAYREALARLWAAGLLFPCTCSRADIATALAAPQEGASGPGSGPGNGPESGPDGPVYHGACRARSRRGPLPDGALRLDMAAAMAALGALGFEETGAGPRGETGRIALDPAGLVAGVGDVILARQGMGTAYHLAVVVDDAAQGVTLVSRGRDLFGATAIHVVLQRLLGLPQPRFHHHRLIRDAAGKRLAKRDDARALATYRAEGVTPEEIRRLVGF